MSDQSLAKQAIDILEKEQTDLNLATDRTDSTVVTQLGNPDVKDSFDSKGVPESITKKQIIKNDDGGYNETSVTEPSNLKDDRAIDQIKNEHHKKAKVIVDVCEIIDKKIMAFNDEINFKKNQIKDLSDIANTGNCWPGTATSSITGQVYDYRTFCVMNEDLENMMNIDNMQGPNKDFSASNVFDPYNLRKLNSSYSGAGRFNIVDGWKYDGPTSPPAAVPATVGFRTDGGDNSYDDPETDETYTHSDTVNISNEVRFEISTTESDHDPLTGIILLNPVQTPVTTGAMIYLGADISDWNGLDDGAACVGIANSIASIYAEIEVIRAERNALRSDLNIIKDKKTEKELVSWGLHNQDVEFAKQKTDNEQAIAAINDLL